MNFAEVRFWEYLLTGLGVLLGLRLLLGGLRFSRMELFDKLALLSLGLFLLLCVSWVTFVIFLLVALGTYVGLAWILKYHARHARKYLLVLIPLQLLPLLFYKYADFLLHRVMALDLSALHGWLNQATHAGIPSLHALVIPVGISFYTFQKVAFVVDTLAFQRPLPRLLDYLNFAGFFPQIVAGPIERRDDLLPQMERFRFQWSAENLNIGASWIALGLFFKCCLADNLAAYFNGASTTNPYLVWMASLLFGLRIYYDFAGYSLVAVGLARCLGVRLTLNFTSPYCSTSVGEFWRRWHITLSQWFRDYLYVPLGGGRVRWWACNVVLVFVVSGIWHGAGWNFVVWGALHGALLCGQRLLPKKLKIPPFIGWLCTLLAAIAAWLAFYETNTRALFAKFRTLLSPGAYHLSALRAAPAQWSPPDQFVLACFLLLAVATLLLEWLSLARRNEAYFYLRRPGVLVLLVMLTVLLAPGKNNGFIYFAF